MTFSGLTLLLLLPLPTTGLCQPLARYAISARPVLTRSHVNGERPLTAMRIPSTATRIPSFGTSSADGTAMPVNRGFAVVAVCTLMTAFVTASALISDPTPFLLVAFVGVVAFAENLSLPVLDYASEVMNAPLRPEKVDEAGACYLMGEDVGAAGMSWYVCDGPSVNPAAECVQDGFEWVCKVPKQFQPA